jgi:hypothetical protein
LKSALQIPVGVLLWLVSIIVCYDLGLILNGPGPQNWGTGVRILVLLVATQWLAAFIFRRHIVLQVFFGLALSTMFVITWLYIGPFWEDLSPDGNSCAITWRSDLAFVLMVAATQWISFWAFRMRIVLKIFGGVVFYVILVIPLLCCEVIFSWEKHLPDGSISISWRTYVLFFLLFTVTQGISFMGGWRILKSWGGWPRCRSLN